jgi:hypothetical protein
MFFNVSINELSVDPDPVPEPAPGLADDGTPNPILFSVERNELSVEFEVNPEFPGAAKPKY